MIISHTHKFIFIKSEKTAGTSIEAALSRYCSGNDVVTPINDYRHNRDEKGEFIHQSMNADEFIQLNLPNLQHVDALTIKNKVPAEVWDSYFKFSITRNPWDKVISDFFWKKRQDPAINPRKRFYNYLGVPFNELDQLKIMFSEFLQSGEWSNNDHFYTIDNQLCVDYVIRYESLLEGLGEVCKTAGLEACTLPRLKSGLRKKRYHYSEYYDEESKAIVADAHKNDIRLFGYEFNPA
ncbi:MAG: sulfotransferase family protein [Gammaproteobacteria bacterium]|nr:sulfotransferase family protein [Gammaproteobacteria bacterium]